MQQSREMSRLANKYELMRTGLSYGALPTKSNRALSFYYEKSALEFGQDLRVVNCREDYGVFITAVNYSVIVTDN